MLENPLVSVLMTAFNREKYIAKAIQSILVSTYTNFELIIVDDCSKDSTVKIASDFQATDNRISLFVNEQNLGDYPNRNQAAKYAKGKYIKYVDADDYIYPWGLELLVDMMERFPDAGWGLCSLAQNRDKPFPFQLSSINAYEYNYFGPGLFHRAPLSSIFKKQNFDEAGGFNNIRMAGDFDMWHRMANRFPVVLMPDGIVWSREHDTQEMNSYRKYLIIYENLRLKYLHHPDCPLNKEQINTIIKNRKKKLRKEILKGIISLNSSLVSDNLKCLKQY